MYFNDYNATLQSQITSTTFTEYQKYSVVMIDIGFRHYFRLYHSQSPAIQHPNHIFDWLSSRGRHDQAQ